MTSERGPQCPLLCACGHLQTVNESKRRTGSLVFKLEILLNSGGAGMRVRSFRSGASLRRAFSSTPWYESSQIQLPGQPLEDDEPKRPFRHWSATLTRWLRVRPKCFILVDLALPPLPN